MTNNATLQTVLLCLLVAIAMVALGMSMARSGDRYPAKTAHHHRVIDHQCLRAVWRLRDAPPDAQAPTCLRSVTP